MLGVCSWSLQPTDPHDLARKVRATGLSAIQLALEPIRSGAWSIAETKKALDGVTILSGMMQTVGEDYTTIESIRRTGGVRPDEHWRENLRRAQEVAAIAERVGLSLVSFHAGFMPEDRADPLHATMCERLRAIADVFDARGVSLALETGQESAAALLRMLDLIDRPNLCINFDPANMILYGTGDPIEALVSLAPRIGQVHLKDARRARVPGQWGEEVPLGQGEVDWSRFFAIVRAKLARVDLVIEREAGSERVEDVRVGVGVSRGFGVE
jgi:sugar phosphate isomerase/epimerase